MMERGHVMAECTDEVVRKSMTRPTEVLNCVMTVILAKHTVGKVFMAALSAFSIRAHDSSQARGPSP